MWWRALKILIVLVIGMFIVGATGQWWLVALPTLLAVGWVSYATRVFPRIDFDAAEIAFAAIGIALLAAGVHAAAVRWRRRRGAEWPVRWSVSAVAGMLLLFAANIAVIGAVHQLGWIFAAGDPVLVDSWGGASHRGRRLCATLSIDDRPADELRAAVWRDPGMRLESRDLVVLIRDGDEGRPVSVVFPRNPRDFDRYGGYVCGKGKGGHGPFEGADLEPVLAENGFRSG